MPILFSAVASGSLVLAQCASCKGNFTEVTREILLKVPPRDEMLTYTSGKFHFHYISANKLVYFCITEDKFPRQKAFEFLEAVKKKFVILLFGNVHSAALTSAAMEHPTEGDYARVLEKEMAPYNKTKVSLPSVKAQLDELKSIMVKDVERLALRGERMETLLDRTEGLAQVTTTYVETSQKVQRKYWWQNMKLYIILVMITPVLVYFIGAMACGGLTWKNCVG